jgi:hypothetical protein
MPLIWAGSAESLAPARSSSQIEFTSQTSRTGIQQEVSCMDDIRRVSYRCRDSLYPGGTPVAIPTKRCPSMAIRHLTKATLAFG